MDCRAFASPKGLRPRSRVKPGNDAGECIDLIGIFSSTSCKAVGSRAMPSAGFHGRSRDIIFGRRHRRPRPESDGDGELHVLNRYDRPSPMAGEAEVKYLDGDFRIVRPGAFVRCAVTGVPIPLEELKYWSVDLQEAYASPEAVLRRLHPKQAG
jgi:hypothetical protein